VNDDSKVWYLKDGVFRLQEVEEHCLGHSRTLIVWEKKLGS